MKKMLSLILVAVLILSFAGCATGGQKIETDKVALTVPDSLIPEGVSAKQKGTAAYFETSEMNLEELQEFYSDAIDQLEGEEIAEMNLEEMEKEEIVPEGEEDATGTIVWAYYARYSIEPNPEKEFDGNVPVFVNISTDGDKYGVAISVGVTAKRAATNHKMTV